MSVTSAAQYGADNFARFGALLPKERGIDARQGGFDRKTASSSDKTDKVDKADKAEKPNELTPEELRQVQQLKQRDREVRQHEQAHLAAGGGLTSGPSFTYQTGPDNQRYAIGGEVSVDASSGRTPEETISRARRIRAAALAPADPSSQDRSVAASAGKMESDARVEIAKLRQEEVLQKAEEKSLDEENALQRNSSTSEDALRFYQNAAQDQGSQLGLRFNAFA